MGISYQQSGIVITDDRNPDRDPLVLPADALPADVSAAILEYLGQPKEPNFDEFGAWLLTNPIIKEAYDIAFENDKRISCTLPPAIIAAGNGEIRHLRTVILLLRRQRLLSSETLTAMLAKARNCNLPDEFLSAIGG